MRGFRKAFGLGLLCFLGVVPAAHAVPNFNQDLNFLDGITILLILFGAFLTPFLPLYVAGLLYQVFLLRKGRIKEIDRFVLNGVFLYTIWVLGFCFSVIHRKNLDISSLSGLAVIILVFNLLGLGIIVNYALYRRRFLPAKKKTSKTM